MDLSLAARDGTQLAATLFEPNAPNGGAVLLNSGTGIARQFYGAFAAHLTSRGFAVLTYDYRGIGQSEAPAGATMEDWGAVDQASMLDHLARLAPGASLAVIGHSFGGQVLGLADNVSDVRAAVLICSQSGHWRHWPRGRRRLRMLALWWLLIPGLTALTGRFPGSWIGTANLPAGIARSWARWGRSPHYVCDARGRPLRPHNDDVTCPVLWLSFSDDPVAPYGAVEALLPYYPNAAVERLHLAPADLGVEAVGHFGFFRKSMPRRPWDEIADWLSGAQRPDAADWCPTRVGGNARMPEPHVLAEVKDGIGWLTLNRPEQLNALSMEMRDLLIEHSAKFEKDPAVRCVVIRGAGTHFMAGGDIRSFHKSLTTEKAAHLAGFEMRVVKAHQAIYQIRRMQKPVLASVQGAAPGFGLSLILNCDLAIASDDSFFTLAYRHIGLSADGGATYFLPRVVGERKALEIALLGERFSAAEAKTNNILNWVVPKDQLVAETAKMARKLADGPTFALGVAKSLIRNSFDNSWDEHSHREAEGLAACAATEDHFEGLNAFLEKRKATFKGK